MLNPGMGGIPPQQTGQQQPMGAPQQAPQQPQQPGANPNEMTNNEMLAQIDAMYAPNQQQGLSPEDALMTRMAGRGSYFQAKEIVRRQQPGVTDAQIDAIVGPAMQAMGMNFMTDEGQQNFEKMLSAMVQAQRGVSERQAMPPANPETAQRAGLEESGTAPNTLTSNQPTDPYSFTTIEDADAYILDPRNML